MQMHSPLRKALSPIHSPQASSFLPSRLVQDLVRLQGEELIRISRELDAARSVNVQLESELTALVRQLNKEKITSIDICQELSKQYAKLEEAKERENGLVRHITSVKESLIEAQDTIKYLLELRPVSTENNSSRQETDSNYNSYTAASTETLTIACHNRKPASRNVPSFCQDETPWKYLKNLRIMRSENAPRILLAGDELVFSDISLETGYIVLPTRHQVRRRRIRWTDANSWKRITTQKHELLINRGRKWFYLGTYIGTPSPCTLEPRVFGALSDKIKIEVYRKTAADPEDKNALQTIAAMYSKGLLRAARINMTHVGVNEELSDGLVRAVQHRKFGSERREPRTRAAHYSMSKVGSPAEALW